MKRIAWTEQENNELINAVNNRGNNSLNSVFASFAQKSNRQTPSVVQHYYQLTKHGLKAEPQVKILDEKQQRAIEMRNLTKKIRKMPDQARNSLIYIVDNMNFN